MRFGRFFARNLFQRVLPGVAMAPLNVESPTPSPGSQGSADLSSSLVLDREHQKVISPSGGVSVCNSIPRVVGHTDTGYAFLFENNLSKNR